MRGGKNPVVVGGPVVATPFSPAGIDSTNVDLERVFPDGAESSDAAAATLDCFDAEFRRGFAAAATVAHDCCCCFLWKLLLLTVAVSPPGTAPTTTGSLTERGNKIGQNDEQRFAGNVLSPTVRLMIQSAKNSSHLPDPLAKRLVGTLSLSSVAGGGPSRPPPFPIPLPLSPLRSFLEELEEPDTVTFTCLEAMRPMSDTLKSHEGRTPLVYISRRKANDSSLFNQTKIQPGILKDEMLRSFVYRHASFYCAISLLLTLVLFNLGACSSFAILFICLFFLSTEKKTHSFTSFF